MAIKRFVIGGAVVALALGLAASANAEILTVTFKGTVISGLDQTGVFGAAGANLTGDSYTAVFTVDDSVKAYQVYQPPLLAHIFGGTEYLPAHGGQPALGTESPVSANFTINGVTASLPGAYYGSGWQSKPATGGEELFIAEDHTVAGSVTSNDYLDDKIASYVNSIAPSYDFHVPFSYTLQPGDEYHNGFFSDTVCDSVTTLCSTYATANLSPTSVTIAAGGVTPPPPTVPEPLTWTMLILGLGMTGFAARRRNECTSLAV